MRFAFALLAAVALCVAKGDGRDSFFAKALPVWSKDDSHKENCARVFEGEFAWTGECTNRFPVLRLAASYGCRAEAEAYFTKMANATGTLWEHSRPNASCCHGFASYIAVLLEAKQNSLSNKEEIK